MSIVYQNNLKFYTMKTNLKNTKSIVAILFVVALFSVNVNAQSNNSSNPVKKVISLIKDYKVLKAENNIVKLTSLIEENVRFKAPTVNECESARPVLLNYNCSDNSEVSKTSFFKREISKKRSISNKMQITNTQSFREWVAAKLEYCLSDLNMRTKGYTLVKFTIDENGKLHNPVILKNTNKDVEKLVIEVLNNSPQWATENSNNKTKREYFLPITYVIQ
jgi:hypothetical protein